MKRFETIILIVGSILLMLSSCLKGDNNGDIQDWQMANAQINAFTLSNDSIPVLASTVFTIDQRNSEIFNKDSLPFGTVIDRKLICSLRYEAGASAIQVRETSHGDTTYYWNGSDSIDFTAPVSMTVYALDGVTMKTYYVKINIHQLNPDSMVWEHSTPLILNHEIDDMKVVAFKNAYYMFTEEKSGHRLFRAEVSNPAEWKPQTLSGFPENSLLAQMVEFEDALYMLTDGGALYVSEDALSWMQIRDTHDVKLILGWLPQEAANGESKLAFVVQNEGKPFFAAMNAGREWALGGEVPASFPLFGFGMVSYTSGYYPRIVIAAGKDAGGNLTNAVWATTNGTSWTKITNTDSAFTPREGAALAYYGKYLCLFGGMDALGEAIGDVYVSKDQGINWVDTGVVSLPAEFAARGFSSVIVDKDNYLMLFGGKANNHVIMFNELWRGRINRLGFKDVD